MAYEKFQKQSFTIILVGVAVLVAYIFRPYFGALVLALTLSVIFTPWHQRLSHLLRGWLPWRGGRVAESMSAALIVLLAVLIVLIPLGFIGTRVVQEIGGAYTSAISNGGPELAIRLQAELENRLGSIAPNWNFDLSQSASQLLNWLSQRIGPLFSSLGRAIVTILLSLLAFYYLLKDGLKLQQLVLSVSPLPDKDDHRILDKLESTVRSVIMGALVVAVLQGIIAGVGFTIFGVPNPSLWGSVAAIAALVPTLGTALVLVPAIAFLLLSGHLIAGLGLLAWGMLAVGLIDNFLGPKIIQRGAEVHPFLILLSVLGGLSLFGPIGFLVGPLALSLLFALLDIYAEIY